MDLTLKGSVSYFKDSTRGRRGEGDDIRWRGSLPSRYFPTEHCCEGANVQVLNIFFRNTVTTRIPRTWGTFVWHVWMKYWGKRQFCWTQSSHMSNKRISTSNYECLNFASLFLDFKTFQLKCLNIFFGNTSTCAPHLKNQFSITRLNSGKLGG